MLKRLLILMLIPTVCFAAAPSRVNTYTPNNVISSSDVTENENAIFNYLQAGVDSFADSSIYNADIAASANIQSDKLNLTSIAQNISNSGTITATSFSGGGALPAGAIFFMASGSCPSWTTDVSATYANKFVKINSTQLTSSGVVLTGTSDGTAITQANLPSFNLGIDTYKYGDQGTFVANTDSSAGFNRTINLASGGSGTAHTHTISSASTLEPSSITMKACLVN